MSAPELRRVRRLRTNDRRPNSEATTPPERPRSPTTTSFDGDAGPDYSDGVVYRIDLVERSLAETIETGLDRQPVPFLKDRELWVAASDLHAVRLKAVG